MARKCHFCLHRLAVSMLPNCVTTCVGRATFFETGNDPDALVTELARFTPRLSLKQELGTKPSVYYLR